jgi:hypothetical protein
VIFQTLLRKSNNLPVIAEGQAILNALDLMTNRLNTMQQTMVIGIANLNACMEERMQGMDQRNKRN